MVGLGFPGPVGSSIQRSNKPFVATIWSRCAVF
jgi:hypothetical protein